MFNKALKKAKENKKGFTLAELLIVVAIIAVLVAISIPIFTSQLEKSRDAVSVSNMRAAYAEAQTAALSEESDTTNGVTYAETSNGNFTVTVANVQIKTQNANEWSNQADELPFDAPEDPGTSSARSMVFTYENGVLNSVAFGA